MTLMNDNMEELKTMGVGEGDICTQSFRKGVYTMVAVGLPVSTTIVSI